MTGNDSGYSGGSAGGGGLGSGDGLTTISIGLSGATTRVVAHAVTNNSASTLLAMNLEEQSFDFIIRIFCFLPLIP